MKLNKTESDIIEFLLDKKIESARGELSPNEKITSTIISKKFYKENIRTPINRLREKLSKGPFFGSCVDVKSFIPDAGKGRGAHYRINGDVSVEDLDAALPKYERPSEGLLLQYIVDNKDKEHPIYLFSNKEKPADAEKKSFFNELRPIKWADKYSRNTYSRMLLVGEGGLGKTTFMLHITRLDLKDYFNNVFYLPLSDILTRAVSAPVPDSTYERNESERYIFREIKDRYGKLLDKKTRCLLLLDGLNELIERDTAHNHDFIMKIRREIDNISKDWQNISMIVSTRELSGALAPKNFVRCGISNIGDKETEALINEKSNYISEPLKKLLCLPLYFNLISRLDFENEISTKYELFHELHKSVLKQATEGKSMTDKSFHRFVYCVLLPALARKMELLRTDTADRALVAEVFAELSAKKNYAARIISFFTGELVEAIDLRNSSDAVFRHITTSFELRKMNDLNFAFSHQDIREYFAAFSVVSELMIMKDAYDSGEICDCDFEFNLKSSVQDLVISELLRRHEAENWYTEPPAVSLTKEQRIADMFRALFSFRHSEIAKIASTKNITAKSLADYLAQEIHLAHGAFALDDHFTLRLTVAGFVHEVTSPIADFCTEERNVTELVRNRLLTSATIGKLLDVLGGETHYFRTEDKKSNRKSDLSKCRRYIEAAYTLIGESSGFKVIEDVRRGETRLPSATYTGEFVRERVLLDHQKAKALLMNASNKSLGIDENNNYFEEQVNEDELTKAGLRLLDSCTEMGYNMSANLVWRIYSTPCMWLCLKYGMRPDMERAFNAVRRSFETMTEGLLTENGTELVYTAKCLTLLLMKGWVKIGENGEAAAAYGNALPDKNTLEYVDKVLKKTKGQTSALYEWVEAMSQLLDSKGSRKEAAKLLSKCWEYKDPNELEMLTALAAFPTGSEELAEFVSTRRDSPGDDAYKKTADLLKYRLDEMKLCICTENNIEKGDTVYALADLKRFIEMTNADDSHTIFAALNNTDDKEEFEKVSDLINSISPKDKELAELFNEITGVLLKNSKEFTKAK